MNHHLSLNTNNWVPAWQELERAGSNVGIEHIINPMFYPVVIDTLARATGPTTLYDFGSGSSSLAFDLLVKDPQSIPGLQLVDPQEIMRARQIVERYVGYEQEVSLVRDAEERFAKFHLPDTFQSIQTTIPFQAPTFTTNALAVSRNFLMHLSVPDLEQHLKQVHDLVGPDGRYIISILNPNYEQEKSDNDLYDGEAYPYKHGQDGELGRLAHYFKNRETYEAAFNQHFTIAHTAICTPMTDDFLQSHRRYYNAFIPLALVYVLRAK